jgi:putative zinc finger/helix-turn-helix YgiT family protein
MTTTKCPICGNQTLEHKQGEYRFEPPLNIPRGTMTIRDAVWDACSSCGEEILPDELTKAIEAEQYRRLGLLTPSEIRQVRQKTGLSAVDLANLLGIGEKSYTRWENGRSMQNRSNDTLIRFLDKNAEAFVIVDAERKPDRERLLAKYVNDLRSLKGQQQYAMAAHGGDLGAANTESLRKRLREIVVARGKKK